MLIDAEQGQSGITTENRSRMESNNPIVEERRRKAKSLQDMGVPLFPTGYRPDVTAAEALERFGELDGEALEAHDATCRMAGRILSRRDFGKASFVHIKDRTGRIQLYIRKDKVGEEAFQAFKLMDIGDIVWARGTFFRTRTNELTLLADEIRLLTKSLRPLPEKWHGLTDKETRYRQRYVDLIVNDDVQQVFVIRSRIVQRIREFFIRKDFLEVETPMMQPIPGGATARPFKTYHNALGMDLYLRVAPELYLKRLVVGGLDRVFEINRNFRNEGVDLKHNPEFTMLEFYMAYATYEDMMALSEELFLDLVTGLMGTTTLEHQGQTIDFATPWPRVGLKEALRETGGVEPKVLEDRQAAAGLAEELGIPVSERDGVGKLMTKLFDHLVEPKLIHPTFITGYPTETSPLSRKSEQDSTITDRFELFIGGKEIANGFTELNDPDDQRERFQRQVDLREAGDREAQFMDEDYIRALEYGLAPTGGEGIGIDRVVMLLTDSPSIRDVIFFPHMRSKSDGSARPAAKE